MHANMTRALLETKMLANTNTRKLSIEKTRQKAEQHFDQLAERIQRTPEVPCFIVAPRSSGRSSLAYRYAQRYRQGDDVHWLDGRSPSFAQGIEAGMLTSFLSKCHLSKSVEQLLIIDDLSYLENHIAERFSNDIDSLIEKGWRVIVITLPQFDCYHNLQSDRLLIGGHELLCGSYGTLEHHCACLAHFLVDELPLEVRLFATLTVLLGELSVEDAQKIGYSFHTDIPVIIADLNPLFSIDKAQPEQLASKGIPILPLTETIVRVLTEFHLGEQTSENDTQILEVLTHLSVELLRRGQHSRSHEILSCIETLYAQESKNAAQPFLEIRKKKHLNASSLEAELGQTLNKIVVSRTSKRLQPLYICLFGSLEVYRGTTRIEHRYLQGSRIQSFLALMLLSARKCISRDIAIQQFWPHMSLERAVNNFHVACSRLSSSLAERPYETEKYLIRNGTMYQLDASLITTDVDQFDDLACRVILGSGDLSEQFDAVYQMERLYRDELLAGTKLDGILQQHRRRQKNQLVDALLVAADIANGMGEAQTALWFTRRAYDYDHAREDVYRAMMNAQLQAGQRTSAIETYFACKDFLHAELGILPSIKTTALYQDLILNQG